LIEPPQHTTGRKGKLRKRGKKKKRSEIVVAAEHVLCGVKEAYEDGTRQYQDVAFAPHELRAERREVVNASVPQVITSVCVTENQCIDCLIVVPEYLGCARCARLSGG